MFREWFWKMSMYTEQSVLNDLFYYDPNDLYRFLWLYLCRGSQMKIFSHTLLCTVASLTDSQHIWSAALGGSVPLWPVCMDAPALLQGLPVGLLQSEFR